MRRWAPWMVMAAVLVAALAWAGHDSRPASPAERSRHLAAGVRCPTCQGQSALESDAPISEAIRAEIDRRVADGQSDRQIRGYLVSRYGRSVLADPPTSGMGGILWMAPLILGVAAVTGIARAARRWRVRAAAGPAGLDERTAADTEAAGSAPTRRPAAGWHGRWRPALRGAALAALGLLVNAGAGARAPGQAASGSIRTSVSDELAAARRLTEDGKVADALAGYERVLAADPRQPEALAYRGLLVALGGSVEEGLASIDRAVAVDPSYAEAHFFRGLVLSGSDGAGAAAEFRAALADGPTAALAAAAQAALDKVSAGGPPVAAAPPTAG